MSGLSKLGRVLHNRELGHGGFLFYAIALIPLLIFTIQPNILGNRFGDIDTWFYLGHFKSLGDYRAINANIAHNYYQTRLPYLIPGYLIFHIFSEPLAKLVFAYLVFGATISALVLSLRPYVRIEAAWLAALLLTCDIFFMRSVGWNYVDNGVVAYFALCAAALTAAGQHNAHRHLWVALSGFSFASMVFIHLGSAVLGIPILAFAGLALRFEQLRLKEFASLLAAAIFGIVVCQGLYGTLNELLWHKGFFFLKEQIAAGRVELAAKPEWVRTADLFVSGDWLAIHLAIWLLSVAALAAAVFRLVKLSRFQWYMFTAVVLTYGILYVLDVNQLSVFLSRAGLYASFGFFLTYTALAGFLASVERRDAFLIAVCFALSLVLRLTVLDGAAWIAGIPSWAIGALFAVTFGVGSLLTNRYLRTAMFCLAAAPTLAIDSQFISTGIIYKAHTEVEAVAGKDLPVFLTSKNDPYYRFIIAPLIAAFTEKAWWLHGPDMILPTVAWQKQKVFIASSEIKSMAEAEKLLLPQVESLTPISFSYVTDQSQGFWISGFEISRRVTLPPYLAKWKSSLANIPGAVLPSQVGVIEGNSRIGRAGESRGGFLTFGPNAALAPGQYRLKIVYGPSDGAHRWDIAMQDKAGFRTISSGEFSPTTGNNAEVSVPLTITDPVSDFQMRSFFTGFGVLSVQSVGIVPVN